MAKFNFYPEVTCILADKIHIWPKRKSCKVQAVTKVKQEYLTLSLFLRVALCLPTALSGVPPPPVKGALRKAGLWKAMLCSSAATKAAKNNKHFPVC